jgi:hypothetical protein
VKGALDGVQPFFMVGEILTAILTPLIATVAVEMAVAVLFRIGRRGILAVGLASGVTNPLMNLVLVVLDSLGLRYRQVYQRLAASYEPTPTWYAVLTLLEATVVVAEWGLLVWALGSTLSSRRLLAVSLATNVASFVLGLTLLW